ncbi:MAG: bacteriochlorophyll 4-vinyl reductase [Clostridia bacterium]|nr:bacteriochlorophyll 4-vinyl reductase [Clostridia bacterium]
MDKQSQEFSLETVITTAVKIPGVKVDRNKFLAETFSSSPEMLQDILTAGPVTAGIGREQLEKLAKKQIIIRTSESSAASFLAGIPGGLAMAATIPADVLQFFGMTLRIAQELSYLYGAQDLWQDGEIDDDKVRNQLILYCGVMFGVTGAAAGVRVLSTQIAKTTLKKLPQKALTKTFWYPIVKKICAAIGVKVTKSTVAQGISKVIPVVGGVISGGLNFASMLPMANRLQATLDKSCFDYSEEELDADCVEIEQISESADTETESESVVKDKIGKSVKDAGSKISGMFGKFAAQKKSTDSAKPEDDAYSALEKLLKLKELGAITEEEYEAKKKELLAKL